MSKKSKLIIEKKKIPPPPKQNHNQMGIYFVWPLLLLLTDIQSLAYTQVHKISTQGDSTDIYCHADSRP